MLKKIADHILEKILPYLSEIDQKIDSIGKDNLYSNKLYIAGKYIANRLGSIDLSDVDLDKIFSTDELEARNSAVFIAFDRYIMPEIKSLLSEQERWIATQPADTDSLMFGRGTYNGILVVKEMLEGFSNQHKQKILDDQEKNKNTENKENGQ